MQDIDGTSRLFKGRTIDVIMWSRLSLEMTLPLDRLSIPFL